MRVPLIALVLLGLQSAGAPPAAIDGRVVALGTDAPVPHATVVVARVGGALDDYRSGVTDAAGAFAFRDLTPGPYRVHVERQGYLRGEFGRRTAGGAGVAVILSEREPSASIVVPMIRTGVIAGRVLDQGRPMADVLVRALRSRYVDGERMLTMADFARTDDLGQYRLFGLAPGTYLVAGAPAPGPRIEDRDYVVPVVPTNANGNRREIRTPLEEALASGAVESKAFEEAMFLPVFHPGTSAEETALPIELRAGDVVTGIDLPLVRVSTARVRGRVFSADGQPAEGVQVSVRSAGAQSVAAIPSALAGRDGFELPAVPPGTYELVTRTPTQYGTATINVGGGDLDGVEIRLSPGVTLTGRVIVQDPPPGFPDRDPGVLSVQLIGRTVSLAAARVGADGMFLIPNVYAGEYLLKVRYRREIPPISARLGANDLTAAPVRIGPETEGLPLEIVVTLATGALDVTVRDHRQRAVAGTVVALVPDPPWRTRSGLYHTAVTDRDGRARLNDVPPGDYSVLAGDVEPSDWPNPDVVRAYEGRGTRVSIRAGARVAVTLEEAR